MVLFTLLYKVVLAFRSVNEVFKKCDFKSKCAELSWGPFLQMKNLGFYCFNFCALRTDVLVKFFVFFLFACKS